MQKSIEQSALVVKEKGIIDFSHGLNCDSGLDEGG